MDQALKHWKMALFWKEALKEESYKGKEKQNGTMGKNTKECGRMERLTRRAKWCIQMGLIMLERLQMRKDTEKESYMIQMGN